MAEDILQTSYLRIVSGKARYAGRSSLRTWLFGVIRRVSLEELRRTRRRERREVRLEGTAERPAERPDPLARVARSERSRRLIELLGHLAERQREVLHLVFYEDLTIAEAAEVMGVSLGTARTHYTRGKENMKKLMEREGHP